MKILDSATKWQTVGQSGAKHLLNNFLRQDNLINLPHAFLFTGPAGVGKYLLAKEFAQKISPKSEILEFDFADSGGVDSLRELIGFASLTTTSGYRKIFILKNFDQALPASSNVMLKTLEEPPASSMFILIANGNRVLPTVMSRCIAIRCFPVANLDVSTKLPKNLSEIVEQYPELLTQLEQQPVQAKLFGDLLGKLQAHQLTLINLFPLLELEATDLQLLVKLWIHSLKQHLAKKLVAQQPAELLDTIHNIKVAQMTHEDLQRSYNTKLVLQQFLIQTR